MDTNNLVIVGRLTGDLNDKNEYYYFGNIACNTSFNKDDKASFFGVKFNKKRFEKVAGFLKKGVRIAIIGYIKQEEYESKKDNTKKSHVYIYANSVQLLDSKKSKDDNDNKNDNYVNIDKNEDTDVIPF